MIRRLTISLIIATVLGSFLATPILAQSSIFSDLLPNCDRTIYIVEANGKIACPDNTINCVTPEQYEEGGGDKYFKKIVGVTVNKNCGFTDFVQLFVNLANWGLGIMAGLALFFYFFGGFQLLISGGRTEYIDLGKRVLTGTTIGVLIILTAWTMTGFYVVATTGSTQGLVFPNYAGKWAAKWYGETSSCRDTYHQEHNQSNCGQNNLHEFCADPIGEQGPITNLQTLLGSRGCNVGAVDGCFGPQTEAAVREFQFVNYLTEDGIVDEDLWTALRDQSGTASCDGPTGCCAKETVPNHWECQENYPEYRCRSELNTIFIDGDCSTLYCSNL